MVTKTRERLIEVARQLFARKGLENTTMNDIAEASDKGRRTLYTYFRNKREIYRAVIEQESDRLVERLRRIAQSATLDPERKLREFLAEEVDLARHAAASHDSTALLSVSLTLGFTGREEKIRRLVRSKEQELIAAILAEGVEAGVFDAGQTARFNELCPMMVNGAYHIFKQQSDSRHSAERQARVDTSTIIEFLVRAVLAQPQPQQSNQS